MTALKPGLAALVVLVSPVRLRPTPRRRPSLYGTGGFAGYPGGGATTRGLTARATTRSTAGFGNYGLPGARTRIMRGYGLSGYGPGANVGGYFQSVHRTPPGVYNNMGGLMSTIKQQTGKSGELPGQQRQPRRLAGNRRAR